MGSGQELLAKTLGLRPRAAPFAACRLRPARTSTGPSRDARKSGHPKVHFAKFPCRKWQKRARYSWVEVGLNVSRVMGLLRQRDRARGKQKKPRRHRYFRCRGHRAKQGGGGRPHVFPFDGKKREEPSPGRCAARTLGPPISVGRRSSSNISPAIWHPGSGGFFFFSGRNPRAEKSGRAEFGKIPVPRGTRPFSPAFPKGKPLESELARWWGPMVISYGAAVGPGINL